MKFPIQIKRMLLIFSILALFLQKVHGQNQIQFEEVNASYNYIHYRTINFESATKIMGQNRNYPDSQKYAPIKDTLYFHIQNEDGLLEIAINGQTYFKGIHTPPRETFRDAPLDPVIMYLNSDRNPNIHLLFVNYTDSIYLSQTLSANYRYYTIQKRERGVKFLISGVNGLNIQSGIGRLTEKVIKNLIQSVYFDENFIEDRYRKYFKLYKTALYICSFQSPNGSKEE